MAQVTAPPPPHSGDRRLTRHRQGQARPKAVVLLVAAVVLLVILGIPAYAYYDVYVAPLQEPVVRVNDRVFTMGDYFERLRYLEAESDIYGRKLDYGVDPFQLMDDLRDSELIRQGAPRMGITATDEEVTKTLKDRVGALPKEGEQATEEEIQQRFQELFKQRLAKVNLTDAKYRAVVREYTLREKLREALSVRVPAVAERVHVLAMMLEDEQAAQDVKKRLEKGEEFGPLARDQSRDQETQENRGDLGWLPRRAMAAPFDDIAFNLPVGAVSDPFFMRRGIWIMKVVEKDPVRQVEGNAREKLKDRALEDWLEEERKQNHVERYFNSDRYELVLNKLKEYRKPNEGAARQ